MRKLALLLAAALFVSAPLIAATPTIAYAATKKKAPAKAPRAAPTGGGGGEAQGGEDLNEVNSRFWRALNDLAISLSKPWPAAGDESAAAPEGGKAPKATKKAKKAHS